MNRDTFLEAVRDGSASADALARIASLALRVTGARNAMVSLLDDDSQCVLGAAGADGMSTPFSVPLDRSVCRHVIASGEQLVVGDLAADTRTADNPSIVDYDLAAYAGMPMRNADGDIVGTVCVTDNRTREWTADEIDALRELAECASTQLSFAQVARERESAREELERSTAFQQAVLDSLTEGVVACDADGKLAYFNRAVRTIHGMPERAIGNDEWAGTYDLYEPDETTALAADDVPLARAFAGEKVRQQHMVVRRHGAPAQHFWANGAPITAADGTLLGAVVAMHEVTDELRRRRMRRAQLSIATGLADGSDEFEVVCTVLAELREALRLTSGEYLEADGRMRSASPAVTRAVDELVLVQEEAADRPGSYDVAVPVTVADDVVGVLHLVGTSAHLLDDLTAAMVASVAAMLGRWRERQRLEALQRDLSSARAVLERVVEQVNDYVVCAERLDDGSHRSVFRSRSEGIAGGPIPADVDWDTFFAERVHADDQHELQRWRDEVRAGLASQMTVRLRGVDERTRWVWTRGRLRVEDGRTFVDTVSTDVTDRQLVQLEREELLRSRKQQVAELQALDHLKDEFVATVTHEIRGPLGLLAMFAENVADGLSDAVGVDAALRRKAGLVFANAEHLQLVVENIFDLARIDAGSVELHKQDVPAATLLAALAEQYADHAGARKVELEVAAGPEVIVHADPSRLRQALENLVSNALKFTPAGGTVGLDGTLDPDTGYVVLRVRDNGIGIPADDLPNLFTRFYRASNARSAATPGTGLGLAVTQSVVAAHDGSVSVHSTTEGPDTGTTFEVRIPAVSS